MIDRAMQLTSPRHIHLGHTSADAVIEHLGLEPLPLEGGYWSLIWRSEHISSINYLISPGHFSALHALSVTELWHYHGGAPAEMLLLYPDGSIERPILGSDLAAGQRPFVGVAPGVWMAAASTGEWSLLGVDVAPPFEDDCFTLGDREELLISHPEAAADIEAFTRPVGEEP